MSLVLVSNHSVEDMQKWAFKYFSSIENKNVILPSFGEVKAFDENNLGRLYKVEPVNHENKLSFFIPIEYVERMHDTKPADYISHCLGHEGEGSLLSALIRENLAVELSAGLDHMLNSISYMMIQVTLTDLGLLNFESVIDKVYAYLRMMQETGPQEEAFHELSEQMNLNWIFLDKPRPFSFVTQYSERMNLFEERDICWILSSMYLFDKFDKEGTRNLVS